MQPIPLRTTVVGSYPFPGWLELASRHLDQFGPADLAELQADAVLAAAILMEAVRRDITRFALVRMAANVALDALLGAVPVIGDLFDAAWKANLRNLALLERHIAAPAPAKRADRLFVLGVSIALVALCVGMMVGGALLAVWVVRRLVHAGP